MNSIRTRFMRTYISAILAVLVVEAVIAFYYVRRSIEHHSGEALCFLSAQKADEMEGHFDRVAGAVRVLGDFIVSEADAERLRTDAGYAASFMASAAAMGRRLARTTESVETFYFRPNAEVYGGTAGVLCANDGAGNFISVPPTDILAYGADDMGHVGWYYAPQLLGSEGWIGPYENLNLRGKSVMSFVMPLYANGGFFGVVGMDMDMALVRRVVDDLGYEAGFGLLVGAGGNLVYHKDFPGGLSVSDFSYFKDMFVLEKFFSERYIDTGRNYAYVWKGVRHRIVLHSMPNGMLLAVSVPESVLLRLQTHMILRMTLLLVATLVLAYIISGQLSDMVVNPVLTLTEASSRIARGELTTPVEFKSKDELGALADSIRKISVELKEYITLISAQAYTDAMTGIRNKSAYLDRVKVLEQRIAERMADFTVYVFDVNGLKRMNDTFGHEYGDMLIKDAAGVLKAVFREDSIYRTGGDEFVVLGEHVGADEIAALFAAFDEKLAAFNRDNDQYDSELAVSKGAATFDEQADPDYKATFDRADKAMYACKESFYKKHEDLRRK